MAIRKILNHLTTSTSSLPAHRGTDITYTTTGTSSGTHLHLGTLGTPTSTSPIPVAGQVAVWNGSDWVAMDGSTRILRTPAPTSIDVVKGWANGIATADNDIIQIRKKNGILYAMKTEVCKTGKWERLDPKDEPVFTDMHGRNLEDKLGNPEAKVVDATTVVAEPVIEVKKIPEIELGWYQDKAANLYKYLGKGIWDTPMKEWEKLLNSAVSGTLEFIG